LRDRPRALGLLPPVAGARARSGLHRRVGGRARRAPGSRVRAPGRQGRDAPQPRGRPQRKARDGRQGDARRRHPQAVGRRRAAGLVAVDPSRRSGRRMARAADARRRQGAQEAARAMTPPAANGGMRASVIGLGRIGAPLAACLAAGGLEVVGVDVDRRRVDALNAGRAPVAEPGLAELLASGPALRATTSVAEAVAASDVTFVTVPTPAEPDGSLSARHVLAAAEELGRALAGKRTGHVVAITSTVMPGSVGGPVTAAITAAAGREREPGIAVAFVPEFVALGSAIADFLAPDFVLIGEPYPGAAPELDELFRVVCRNEPPILRTGLIEAELAKLAIN